MDARKNDKFIQDLQKTGLNYEESIIYFALIQKGEKGVYASDLASEINVKRTTMLSKLDHLLQKGCVRVDSAPLAPRGIKRFFATNPGDYINQQIQQKRK